MTFFVQLHVGHFERQNIAASFVFVKETAGGFNDVCLFFALNLEKMIPNLTVCLGGLKNKKNVGNQHDIFDLIDIFFNVGSWMLK